MDQHSTAADCQFNTPRRSILPGLASRLIGLGHLDEVQRQAARGEWHCARAVAEHFVRQADHEVALAVVRPFADAGWWDAVSFTAGLLADLGRIGEAAALVRPFAAKGRPTAVQRMAQLAAQTGRIDEAIAILSPRLTETGMPTALVDLTAGTGRDSVIEALLRRLYATKSDDPGGEAKQRRAVSALAAVVERQ